MLDDIKILCYCCYHKPKKDKQMDLKTVVTFNLFARNIDNHERYDICSIDDIRRFINEHINLFDTPCHMEVFRKVHIVDLDEPETGTGFEKFQKTYFKGFRHITDFYHSDTFKFVFPVMYPNDIRKYVSQHPQYKALLELGLDEKSNDVPVVLCNYEDKTPNHIRFGTRWVSLNQGAFIGVDNNMNQVYPVATREPPIALIKFLKDNKVTIR